MKHPTVIHAGEAINNLRLTGKTLEKLIAKPKPILWNRGGMYLWVPIERVRNAVRAYQDMQKTIYPPPDKIEFNIGDTVPIPKEAGDVIVKYNGKENE